MCEVKKISETRNGQLFHLQKKRTFLDEFQEYLLRIQLF